MPVLRLRPATAADEKLVRAWRNDPVTLEASGNTEPVSEEEHREWFDGLLAAHDRHLLIAEDGSEPIGQVRFELLYGDCYQISVSIVPERRGSGHGARLIADGVAWLRRRIPDARVTARVRSANEVSLRAFDQAGFSTTDAPPEPGWELLEQTVT